jgi:hypothetical protein
MALEVFNENTWIHMEDIRRVVFLQLSPDPNIISGEIFAFVHTHYVEIQLMRV